MPTAPFLPLAPQDVIITSTYQEIAGVRNGVAGQCDCPPPSGLLTLIMAKSGILMYVYTTSHGLHSAYCVSPGARLLPVALRLAPGG